VREPGSILLIACYELGRPPLSLASPLGMLARAGYRPASLDTAVELWDEERVRCARFVGIAVPMHTAMRLGVRVAGRVREINPSAHLCFYGLYASLNAAYLLECGADSVIGGEYERPLLELVSALESGAFSAAPVPGVSDSRRLSGPSLQRTDFALPMRETLPPLPRYARLQWRGEEVPAGYVEASRGCAHCCLHCPITPVYDGRFFAVPRDLVLADIDAQVSQGARHITFGDPDFLNGPTHALKLARELHARHPGITFDFTTKVEHILQHRALFPEFGALGCIFVVSAIESFSDQVLARLEKGHTAAEIETALGILEGAGIAMRPSLVAFTPWTTWEDYREMLDRVEALGLVEALDPVQYSIRLLVPPGSALLRREETREWLGELDPPNFAYRWAHPDPRMDALHRQVTRRVEEAARRGEGARETFASIRDLVEGTGDRSRRTPIGPRVSARSVPRLTEAWFC
jgi:radical SAM superfamily enzyme YgiQ (UPF0313 family)